MSDEQKPSRQIKLPNGIILDPDEAVAPSLQDYAKEKGFTDIRVVVATHPNGAKNYLIVKGNEPYHESQSFEDICVKIDMMALVRDWKDQEPCP